MLKLEVPKYKFCPFCGEMLVVRVVEGKKRKYCKKDNWTYYPAVKAASGGIIIKETKVLLVQRAREPYIGRWMYPAGFIDFGEHPEDTLRREIKEETNLKVTNIKFFRVAQVSDDFREPGHFAFTYLVEVEDGEIKTDLEENLAIGWFELKKLPPLAWKNQRENFKILKSTT